MIESILICGLYFLWFAISMRISFVKECYDYDYETTKLHLTLLDSEIKGLKMGQRYLEEDFLNYRIKNETTK